MFGMGSIIGGVISGAINAANNANKNKGNSSPSTTTSGSSSGGSRQPSGSSQASSGSSTSYTSSSSNKYPSSSSGNKYSSSYGGNNQRFDVNTDYQALINQSVSKGDYQSAAKYEQLRNEKIDAGYGKGSQKTNNYSGYLGSSNKNNWSSLHEKTDWSQEFQDNMSTASVGQLQNILNQRLDKLGGNADAWQNQAQNYVNGLYNQTYGPQKQAVDEYKKYMAYQMMQYQQKQDAIRKEQQALVDKNVAALNAQKNGVYQAGIDANAAAQQNYMNMLNPNGANNEQFAALGLVGSGMSESAAISAQNAYTSAVNSNQQNVSNQIQAIELAIQNARLSGDIATAQQLQSFYDNVMQMGMQNANNILAANQWAITNGQNMNQQGINNAFTQAGMTGNLNGNQTMQGQQLAYTIEGLSLDNQMKQFQLLLQKAFGYQQAEAELEAQKLANSGASLANTYQQLYNQYLKNTYDF